MLRKEMCAEGMQKKNICYLSRCCTERATLALLLALGTITIGQPNRNLHFHHFFLNQDFYWSISLMPQLHMSSFLSRFLQVKVFNQ